MLITLIFFFSELYIPREMKRGFIECKFSHTHKGSEGEHETHENLLN